MLLAEACIQAYVCLRKLSTARSLKVFVIEKRSVGTPFSTFHRLGDCLYAFTAFLSLVLTRLLISCQLFLQVYCSPAIFTRLLLSCHFLHVYCSPANNIYAFAAVLSVVFTCLLLFCQQYLYVYCCPASCFYTFSALL